MNPKWTRCGLVLAVIMVGCSHEEGATVTSPVPADFPRSAPTEDAGNNLSFPVIWSDGYAKPLRGTYGTATFEGAFELVGGVPAYLQQDPLNEWQAESVIDPGGPVDVTWIDWGDNLEARPWSENSVVRVEVVLIQDLTTPLDSYEMLYVSGEGVDEMWGASSVVLPSDQATVYSHCARLIIQKIEPLTTPEEAVLTWNAENHRWDGEVSAPYFDSGVWEAVDGVDGFSAEINIKGKVVYGYNWMLRRIGDGAGVYRLTFSLAQDSPLPAITVFDQTRILTREEVTEGLARAEDDSGEPVGGIAHVDPDNDLTWIDVQIVPRSGGNNKRPFHMR